MKHFFEKYKKALIPIAAVSCLLIFFTVQSKDEKTSVSFQPHAFIDEEQSLQQINNPPQIEENPTTPNIIVDVKGAIQFPGVYTLTEDDRVIDAIQMAGGYLDEADPNQINHAQKLIDEMVIYVPRKGEELSDFTANTVNLNSTQNSSGKVNLNTATESELTTLPGIGPSKAQAIIEYRNQNGRFQSIEDLKKISGIGEKTFEKLKEHISI